jgi:plastocyanin
MRRFFRCVVAAIAFGALAVSCGGSSSSSHSSATVPANAGAVVDAKNIAFNPSTVTVKAGQTVAWKFDDGSVPHNVVGEGFHSPDMSSGVFTHTFGQAGDFKYECTIHGGMNGDVIVK